MKKLTFVMAAVLLVLGFSQCKKEKVQNEGSGEKQHIVLSAGNGNDGSKVTPTVTGAVLGLTWEGTDVITVTGGATGTLTLKSGEGETHATFEGDITKVNDDDLVFTFGSVDYTGQTGDISWVKENICLEGRSAYSPSGDYEVDMLLTYALLKLDLSSLGTAGGNTVTVKVGSETKATVLNVANTAAGLYVALPTDNAYDAESPAEVTYTFEGNSKSIGKAWTIKQNMYYTNSGSPIVVTMVAPVETDEWINFNDPGMEVTGLPIWAKYNLGVDKNNLDHAYDWYGHYYSWGEVAPYYTSINWTSATSGSVAGWKTDMTTGAGNTDLTSGYAWKSYSQGASTIFVEWSTHPYGSDNVLTQARDAAYQNATPANTWRMPKGGSSGEWKQLQENTLFVWTTSYRGITNLAGYVVYKVKNIADKGVRDASNCTTTVGISNDGGYSVSGRIYAVNAGANYQPHMFLPAAGIFYGTSLYYAGSYGDYWSSSLYSDIPYDAWSLYFYSGSVNPQNHDYYRCDGFTVRPVQ